MGVPATNRAGFVQAIAALRRRGQPGNVAREVALRLCRELLSVSAAEIAAALDVAPSGLSLTVRRVHERIKNDAEFAQAVVELRVRLGRYTWEDLTAAVILAKLSVGSLCRRVAHGEAKALADHIQSVAEAGDTDDRTELTALAAQFAYETLMPRMLRCVEECMRLDSRLNCEAR